MPRTGTGRMSDRSGEQRRNTRDVRLAEEAAQRVTGPGARLGREEHLAAEVDADRLLAIGAVAVVDEDSSRLIARPLVAVRQDLVILEGVGTLAYEPDRCRLSGLKAFLELPPSVEGAVP